MNLNQKKIILVLRTVDSSVDARVSLLTKAIALIGFNPVVLDWSQKKQTPHSDYQLQRFIAPRLFQHGLLKTFHFRLGFQFFALNLILKHRNHIHSVHCCDIDSCFLIFFALKIIKIPYILDILDIQSEAIANLNTITKKLLTFIESSVIQYASKILSVDENRISQIQNLYFRKDIMIVNNVTEKLDKFHSAIQQNKPTKVYDLVYIGNLSEDRGIRYLLEAAQNLPMYSFLIGGYGILSEKVQKVSEDTPNITFLGQVEYEDAINYILQSRLMLATYDGNIPNNRLSSPNKLFESMAFGIPIIVAENTWIDLFVKRHKIGVVVAYGKTIQLENVITKLLTESEVYENMSIMGFAKYDDYSFSKALENLSSIYTGLN